MAHPFIPVPNCASVELIYSFNGVTCENQIHVQKGSPYTLAQLSALRVIVVNWFNTTGKALSVSQVGLTRVRSRALDSVGSPVEDFTVSPIIYGTSGNSPLPGNATLAIKLGTGLAGRSFRGRWYVVGLGAGNYGSDANNIAAGWVVNWVGYLNTLMTVLAAGGNTLGVVSYRTGGAYRVTGLFTAAIGWVAVDGHIDSMRRRLTGRGI